jgi:hypothetical protein
MCCTGVESIPRTKSGIEKPSYILAGWYDDPMPAWFLAPIAGLKLPTQAPKAGGIDSLHVYKFGSDQENFVLYVKIKLNKCTQGRRKTIICEHLL